MSKFMGRAEPGSARSQVRMQATGPCQAIARYVQRGPAAAVSQAWNCCMPQLPSIYPAISQQFWQRAVVPGLAPLHASCRAVAPGTISNSRGPARTLHTPAVLPWQGTQPNQLLAVSLLAPPPVGACRAGRPRQPATWQHAGRDHSRSAPAGALQRVLHHPAPHGCPEAAGCGCSSGGWQQQPQQQPRCTAASTR